MTPDPLLGVIYHWLGGLAAGSFYLPYKGVRRWSWETYWLVGGVFSWVIAPALVAVTIVPHLGSVLRDAPASAIFWTYFWGLMWGVGGLTFGLSLRYLGMSLGYAVALGFCAVFGTLMPPLFAGTMGQTLATRSGQIVLLGMVLCLIGIAIAGVAGRRRERELPRGPAGGGAIVEFNFLKGVVVAIFAGVLSASMAYGLAAAEPIAAAALAHGAPAIWSGLPKLVVVLAGGFTTNAIWCLVLNARNGTAREYVGRVADPADRRLNAEDARVDPLSAPAEAVAGAASPIVGVVHDASRPRRRVPLAANYLLCAAAGVMWYLQFFFYTMGETQMGAYKFSSWTLHMASIIIFSTLWGVALKEWKGTSGATRTLVAAGLATLIAATVVIGYGNYSGAAP